ncbi:MAG: Stealth CR1 domain-containing protein [Muribaculaceae bacterium]|nr:Stealth CR1 domain-containing protein [Muribaculaceae bacterium]
METKVEQMDIDLVYLWVDGEDPKWQAKFKTFIGKTDENSSNNCKGRYVNNDELKYSLRSIENYAPWVRNIFIVTDNQVPEWLDLSHPKIKIIDHKEILPKESRPCFNSCLLEYFLYRIPGLAEHFLYANDDMFLNKPTTPETFFTAEGLPIIRLTRKPFRKLRWFFREEICKKPLKNYSKTIGRAAKLVEKKYGRYFTGMPHHNIDAYLRSDYQRIVEKDFRAEYSANKVTHLRHDNDIQRSIISYVALAKRRGELCYVSQNESIILMIHKENHYRKFTEKQPMFFCMNDSEYAQDTDRMKAMDFLEKLFPAKSEFEK